MPTKIQLRRGLNADIGGGTNKVLINPIDKPSGLNITNTYTKLKVNEYGQAVQLSNLIAADISPILTSQVTGLGTASTANTGTSPGNVPVLDGTGKLAASTLPSIAITDTFIVASQVEMIRDKFQP
ncbi:MAG: hypothetical protein GX663_01965 [Clostridiales bacterium]|nr:hypothetical protein [Clostridiales bacterium]